MLLTDSWRVRQQRPRLPQEFDVCTHRFPLNRYGFLGPGTRRYFFLSFPPPSGDLAMGSRTMNKRAQGLVYARCSLLKRPLRTALSSGRGPVPDAGVDKDQAARKSEPWGSLAIVTLSVFRGLLLGLLFNLWGLLLVITSLWL